MEDHLYLFTSSYMIIKTKIKAIKAIEMSVIMLGKKRQSLVCSLVCVSEIFGSLFFLGKHFHTFCLSISLCIPL